MRTIAVVGATGHTGLEVVDRALARGNRVRALARRPEAISTRHPELETMEADVLDQGAIVEGLAGADAVVSAIGIGASRKPTVVYSDGIANVLHAMETHHIATLVAISAAPVGDRDEQPVLERRIAFPILERIFGSTYEDMRRMESRLRASSVDWISLRPPRLVARKATGAYRLDANRPLPRARSLTYADLATALLDVVDRGDLRRQAVFVAN